MSELLVSVNEQRVTRLSVRIPRAGAWQAEGDFDQALTAANLVGPARIAIGPLSLLGTFDSDRTGTYLEQSKFRILGGAGKWRTDVAKRQYHDDGLGVRAVDVIADLAREVGETLGTVTPPLVRLGADYVRRAGRAKDVLALVIGTTPWWVDAAGVTQVGERPQVAITGEYELLEFDPRWQIATIATDDPTAIAIGSVLQGKLDAPRVVSEISIEAADGKVRLSCWCPELVVTDSRLFSLVAAYVRASLPELPFLGMYRYRVIQANSGDNRWELQAMSASQRLPDIQPAAVHPGVAGIVAKLPTGTTVLVQFVEGNPALPVITHFEAADGAGFIPTELTLCAGSTGASPTEHGTSSESLVAMFDAFCAAINVSIPGVVTGAGLVAAKAAIINAAIPLTCTVPITPYVPALAAALAAKLPNTSGDVPGPGWPSVRGG